MQQMVLELSVATAMVLATIAIHGIGLLGLARLLAAHDVRRAMGRLGPLSVEGAAVPVAIVLGLFILHGLEIWLYAVLFTGVGAAPDIREAVYFSTISYGAIGYSDSAIAPDWKLLGAIEGINGAILLGWSVAFFVNVMARMFPPVRGR